MNTLRQVKGIVYRLKRNFGTLVKIIHATSTTYDIQTGETVREESLITVRRGIVVTPKMTREFSYDLSFIAANKNFTYGGFYDESHRILIVDRKDLPRDYEPNLNHRAVVEDQRYEFEQISKVTGDTGFMIRMVAVSSAPSEDIHQPPTRDSITLTQETS